MAKDLKSSLPDTNGFSRTNLFAMRKFYLFYAGSELVNRVVESMEMPETQIVQQAAELIQKEEKQIFQQVAGQLEASSILCKIPWWHHHVILSKCKTIEEAEFYVKQTFIPNTQKLLLFHLYLSTRI